MSELQWMQRSLRELQSEAESVEGLRRIISTSDLEGNYVINVVFSCSGCRDNTRTFLVGRRTASFMS